MKNSFFQRSFSGFDIYFHLFYDGKQSIYVGYNPNNHLEAKGKTIDIVIGEILKIEQGINKYLFTRKLDPTLYE